MQDTLYDYVINHCDTEKNEIYIKILRRRQVLFTQFDLFYCLRCLGISNYKPADIQTVQSGFQVTNLSESDLEKLEEAVKITVSIKKNPFKVWLRQYPKKTSSGLKESLGQVLNELGIPYKEIKVSDSELQIELPTRDSLIFNKTSKKIFDILDKNLEEKKKIWNIDFAMQKAIEKLESLKEPEAEKKIQELKKIRQDFSEVSGQISPKIQQILSEIKDFVSKIALPVKKGPYASNDGLKIFFKYLQPESKDLIFSAWHVDVEAIKNYQKFQDMLQQQPEAMHANFLHAMEVATDRWLVGNEGKFKELLELKEKFQNANEDDKSKYLQEFLLKAAQPRHNCFAFFNSQFAETKSCSLFFSSLNQASKISLFKMLGKGDIQNPSFDDFSKLLNNIQQKKSSPNP